MTIANVCDNCQKVMIIPNPSNNDYIEIYVFICLRYDGIQENHHACCTLCALKIIEKIALESKNKSNNNP